MSVTVTKTIPFGKLQGRKITNRGDVYGILKTTNIAFVTPFPAASGLLKVRVQKKKVREEEFVHLLVARTFLPNKNGYELQFI